jgi:N6-adenosine-specific RNA methylase IME4
LSLWFFEPLIPHAYDVIVIDPPWHFKSWSDTRQTKAASQHYSLMENEDILALPVSQLADRHCLLLLWSTGAMMPLALEAMQAWGFTYKSQIVWRKVTRMGRVRMGTGFWARSMHETVLIGTIGKPAKATFPSLFDGVAREHSRKPEEFYALVEKVTPGRRRCDVFARVQRPGWNAFGDETEKFEDTQGQLI